MDIEHVCFKTFILGLGSGGKILNQLQKAMAADTGAGSTNWCSRKRKVPRHIHMIYTYIYIYIYIHIYTYIHTHIFLKKYSRKKLTARENDTGSSEKPAGLLF